MLGGETAAGGKRDKSRRKIKRLKRAATAAAW
jgi:hypothetical protein